VEAGKSIKNAAANKAIHKIVSRLYITLMDKRNETFEKCSILFKVKEGENFNHKHTLSIPRIKI
jgi:hypothetical protein